MTRIQGKSGTLYLDGEPITYEGVFIGEVTDWSPKFEGFWRDDAESYARIMDALVGQLYRMEKHGTDYVLVPVKEEDGQA
jgi:hypothetical protein